MIRSTWVWAAVSLAVTATSSLAVTAADVRPAEIMASPIPSRSPGSLPPLPPPAGLPTAPPPDAIKPIEPQAQPERPAPTGGDVRLDPTAAPDGRRYLAVIPGDCERLVVADRELTTGCTDKLVNIDFGDGRVMFVFTTPTAGGTVMTAFSGHASEQKDLRTYRLQVDEVTTTTADTGGERATVATAASGHCDMQGDPLVERALFRCSADGTRRTVASFRSRGTPAVYAELGDAAESSPLARAFP